MAITTTDRAGRVSALLILEQVARRCVGLVKELQTRSSIRRSMGKLSKEQLRDIGMIAHDLEAACSRGLSQPAVSELEAVALGRSGNW